MKKTASYAFTDHTFLRRKGHLIRTVATRGS